MKAIVQEKYGPLDNLRLVEREKPAPSGKTVLIRARAAGWIPAFGI
jgi:NADPH:quinone reductase-like Zn-dependent oxidoreductase